ncbi:MAG: tRNA (adenosine(37)-N6)-threonylcarbamoyltransferase complex dimerization subunit type 1 TsaB [Halothermotrichaceae bacterium]
MLVLGVDTSSEVGAVGLVDEKGVLGEINIRLYRRHSEELLSNIDHLLQQTDYKVEDIEGISVTNGPGSFTGLRIALSTVKIFAQALKIPVMGVSTLDMLSYNMTGINSSWLVPVMDARRQRVYTSLYTEWNEDIRSVKVWDDTALSLDVLIQKLKEECGEDKIYIFGDGVNKYRNKFKETGLNIRLLSNYYHIPRGSILAELGRFYLEKGLSDNYMKLLPNYLKKPQAEINWLKKHKDG